MTEKQLGAAPSTSADIATKAYADLNLNPVTTEQDTTLTASLEHLANGTLEVGSSYFLEVPATSTLEIFLPQALGMGAGAPANAYVGLLESLTFSNLNLFDLTTTTDQVTVTIGPNRMALVTLSCYANNTAANQSLMGFAVSGANTIAAGANGRVIGGQMVAGGQGRPSGAFLLMPSDLPSQGVTTFKAKYQVDGGIGSYADRRIAVIPL